MAEKSTVKGNHMIETSPVERLRTWLAAQPLGQLADRNNLHRLLVSAWELLSGHDETRMKFGKLWRIEAPEWDPPVLRVEIAAPWRYRERLDACGIAHVGG